MAWNLIGLFGFDVLQILIELLIIWMCVFFAFIFLRGTRGAGIFLGLVVILMVLLIPLFLLGEVQGFERLAFFSKILSGGLIFLVIVIFQPELRQAAIRITQSDLLALFRHMPSVRSSTISAIADAVIFLSRNQYGALIAIERENSTIDHVIGGQNIDAQVSTSLLQSIFWPNNPLHDLGLVLRGDRVTKACVQFPLADESAMLSANLGSRHRAAVGLSLRCDALIIVVSEQTGRISFADQGTLTTVDPDDVESKLAHQFTPSPETVGKDQHTTGHTEDQPSMDPESTK